MGRAKLIMITIGAAVVVAGGVIYDAVTQPTGPGSGDELEWEGPGSGDELTDEPTGPGSGDELWEGPGSGDELWDGPGSGDEIWGGPGSGDELIVMSSCNIIGAASTCVDYVGSYWKNDNYAKLNCSRNTAWSKKYCPKDYVGGCLMNSGTPQEMITWHYGYGGVPYDAKTAQYAAMACNANPFGTWIGK